ncbi:MAG: TetR/AcrR family transcriptional regulator [Chloroflexota bacterium]
MSLSRNDWIQAAGRLMAEKDVAAVKVEPLAKILKVSKGSFYWHFENRSALLVAILEYWEKETDWLIQESQRVETPLKRLVRLFALIGETASESGGQSIDMAIFRWANQAPDVLKRVHHVEAKRVQYIQKLLEEAGFPLEVAIQRGELMYLAFLGYTERSSRVPSYRSAEVFEQFGRLLIDRLLHDKPLQDNHEDTLNEE